MNDISLPLLEKYSEIKCSDSKKTARPRHAAVAAACFSGLCRCEYLALPFAQDFAFISAMYR